MITTVQFPSALLLFSFLFFFKDHHFSALVIWLGSPVTWPSDWYHVATRETCVPFLRLYSTIFTYSNYFNVSHTWSVMMQQTFIRMLTCHSLTVSWMEERRVFSILVTPGWDGVLQLRRSNVSDRRSQAGLKGFQHSEVRRLLWVNTSHSGTRSPTTETHTERQLSLYLRARWEQSHRHVMQRENQ